MQFVPNRADLGTLALRAGGTGRRYCRLVTNDMDPGQDMSFGTKRRPQRGRATMNACAPSTFQTSGTLR